MNSYTYHFLTDKGQQESRAVAGKLHNAVV